VEEGSDGVCCGCGFTDWIRRMSFTETLMLDVSPEEAFTRSVRAAELLGWGLKEANPQTRSFCALTSAGVRSFGETVTAEIVPAGTGSEIRVRSECRAQLVSWGKNSQNVISLFQAIQQPQASSDRTEGLSMGTANTTTVAANGFCTSCGTPLQNGNRFCGKCGAALTAGPAAPASSIGAVPFPQVQKQGTNFAWLSDYYQSDFRMIESSGERYQGKWNWAAFFFGAIWALTKGLWVPALICFVGSIFTGGIAGVIYWFIFGARGNYMYYRKVTRGLNPAY